MRTFDSGRVQDKLLDKLEKQERRDAFQRDRFFRFKLQQIERKLCQALLMEKVIETTDPAALSDLLLRGLKKFQKTNEFEFKYFVAPLRDLVPRANPISLYMTQYILEVVINDPCVIELYGTDLEIYKVVNTIVSQVNADFTRAEDEILQQLARNQSLAPGSREYDIALEQMVYQRFGEPQK